MEKHFLRRILRVALRCGKPGKTTQHHRHAREPQAALRLKPVQDAMLIDWFHWDVQNMLFVLESNHGQGIGGLARKLDHWIPYINPTLFAQA